MRRASKRGGFLTPSYEVIRGLAHREEISSAVLLRATDRGHVMPKETVIIVHGTWAAPEPGVTKWYQRPTEDAEAANFVAKLDAALDERGSAARCWAHCADGQEPFRWSGDNSWIARRHAAAKLGEYVARLQGDGWRCHVVAHSHGGNVVVEALPKILARGSTPRTEGRIITLGTPFIDTVTPIYNRGQRAELQLFTVVAMLFALFIIGSVIVGIVVGSAEGPVEVILSCLITVLITYGPRRTAKFAKRWFGVADAPTDDPSLTAPAGVESGISFHAIGSRRDEAWQVLHHLQTIDNPIRVKSGFFANLKEGFQAQMRLGDETDSILGVGSLQDYGLFRKIVVLGAALFNIFFFPIFILAISIVFYVEAAGHQYIQTLILTGAIVSFILFPIVFHWFSELSVYAAYIATSGQWMYRLTLGVKEAQKGNLLAVHFTRSVASVPGQILTYFIRGQSWQVLVTMALGLDGYRFGMPSVLQRPAIASARYEDLPASAEQRALNLRSAWVERNLGDITELFSKLSVTSADVSSLLRMIEADASLVHGAYYTDDDCIHRIAELIAG